jgi:hypothetical protein
MKHPSSVAFQGGKRTRVFDKGSQVPGSTFKVGDKDRMDDPKTCRSRLSSLKQVPMDSWFSWANAKNGVVIRQAASNVEPGGQK